MVKQQQRGLGTVLLAIALVQLLGCSAPARQPAAPPEAGLAAEPLAGGAVATSSETIVFNDLGSFDRDLEKSLQRGDDRVIVTVHDRISLKQMPPRVDRWLAAVDGYGGKIDVRSDIPEPRQRALPLLGLVLSAIQYVKDITRELQYYPARKYDAVVIYKRDASGDRLVDRIEWVRRRE